MTTDKPLTHDEISKLRSIARDENAPPELRTVAALCLRALDTKMVVKMVVKSPDDSPNS